LFISDEQKKNQKFNQHSWKWFMYLTIFSSRDPKGSCESFVRYCHHFVCVFVVWKLLHFNLLLWNQMLNFCGIVVAILKMETVEIFRRRESIQVIIIYLHMKCCWNRTLLNLCGIVVAILKMALLWSLLNVASFTL
jgi:hypothetical protein